MIAELQAFGELERPRIEAALELSLSGLAPPVGAAAAYSVRAGGKRIRPLLALACHRAVGGDPPDGMSAVHSMAAAVELIHTYSLLHDDLPAMDDDLLRRGLPTAHRVYGVPIATAAGAALQQQAFLTLARAAAAQDLQPRLPALLRRLAIGAGVDGMVGGQYLDLEAEGKPMDGAGLEAIHRSKTAALFATACALGAIAGGGEPDQVEALAAYGTYLGLAFQIVDDLLDETGDEARLGKAVGADRRLAKATYPAVYGIEAARRLAERVAGEARASLAGLDDPTLLEAFVDYVLERLE